MPLAVSELKNLLAASSGKTFSLSGDKLGVGRSAELFGAHLTDGTLTVSKAVTDSARLTVSGNITLKSPASATVSVTFTADGAGESVSGYTVTISLSTWAFATVTVSADYGDLSTHFGFTQPGIALTGQGDTGRALFTCALDNTPFEAPLDGSASLSACSGATKDTSLYQVASTMGFALLKDLDVSLTDLWFRYDTKARCLLFSGTVKLTTTNNVRWVLVGRRGQDKGPSFAGVIEASLDLALSGLPVLSSWIPKEHDVVMTQAALVFAKDSLTNQDVVDINAAIGAGGKTLPTLPPGPLAAGVTATLGYKFGGVARDALKIQLGSASSQVAEDDQNPSAQTEQQSKPESHGPIRLDGISLGYAKGCLQIFTNIIAAIHGFTVEISRFTVAVPLNSGVVDGVRIDGFGISETLASVTIKAVLLLRQDKTYPVRLDGLGMLSAPAISLAFVGSYARKNDGTTSFFLFGSIGVGSGKEGFGPTAFRVKQVYLGGGLNTAMRIGTVAEISTCPFVAGLDDPSIIGENPDPIQLLDVLRTQAPPWVTDQAGENWFAAGLHWTTFEFAEFRALAVVEFGTDLVITLLGLGRFDFPKTRTPGETLTAHLEIAAEALYRHSEGLLSLAAQFTRNSFVYFTNYKPTGGIALCMWVDPSPHQGDFVICVGGYHPAFVKPGWYPSVPRISVVADIDEQTNLTAAGYLTIAPHGLMFGGALAVQFRSGSLSAWATVHLDTLIQWAPFSYDISVGVSFGVSYTIKVWFVHVTINVELGVDVELWGPPFGGNATLHLEFVSFTIGFGEPRPDDLPPCSWTQFQAQLPPKEQAVQMTPTEGLTPTPKPSSSGTGPAETGFPGADEAETWVVSTHGFTFTTATAVPAMSLVFCGKPVQSTKGTLPIRAMDTDATSTHAVTVTHQDGPAVDVDRWIIAPILGNTPKALWGKDAPDLNDPDGGLVPKQLIGLRVTVPAPDFSGTLTTGAGNLNADPLPDGPMPYNGTATPVGPKPTATTNTIQLIATGIAAPGPTGQRAALHNQLQSLGYDVPDDPLPGYAASAGHSLAAQPLLVPAGGEPR
ncbi:DUF6603 domain-containing protein [Saccharopolyspora phatthalungensis]|uniref:DUF6603 domain-containing protein n=1 Tax=Saccharopolyspora phatthalungensis TaxID=664693 RepID=A0A840Q3C7_9PSEU|nr:DUF6603 domain-containing protein [Saccharopolyspora phatthalungensis]MBB5157022.1 hypothetical protein [Saccharopolyspora phatthalungensis]